MINDVKSHVGRGLDFLKNAIADKIQILNSIQPWSNR